MQDQKMEDQNSLGGICRTGKCRTKSRLVGGICRAGKWTTWTIKDHLRMHGHVTMHMPSKGFLPDVIGCCLSFFYWHGHVC